MAQAGYSLGNGVVIAPASSRRWVVTPICISLLAHFILLAAIEDLEWFELAEFERQVEQIFTIRTGSVRPEELERVSMMPEQSAEDVYAILKSAPGLSPELFQDRRDTGPDESLPEMKAAPRYPEEELPLVSRSGLSERSQAFVRDGELEAIESGEARVSYIPSRRGVGPAPGRYVAERPRLRDPPAAIPRLLAGTKGPFTDAGTAPRLALRPPPLEGTVPGLGPAGLGRNAEDLFADRPPPPELKPLPLDVKIDVYAERGSKYRFFRLVIRERGELRLPVMQKSVLFVVDISLSINARTVRRIRAAVARAAAGLNPGDRLNAIRFSEQSYKAFEGFVPATRENIARAAAFVKKIPGQMQTDVYSALKEVLAALPRTGPGAFWPTNVYLVSDGNPTAGLKDIRRIVNDVSGVTQSNYSLFALNPGARRRNTYLLDLLTYRSRGVFVRAETAEDADAALLGLLLRFKDPILINLHAQYGNFEVDQVYPQTLPNVYSGQPIVIHGRCLPGETIAVRLLGDSAKARRRFLFTRTLPEVQTDDPSIAREWARGKIHHLTSLIARHGEKAEYLAEIRRLSKRYKLASPYR